MTLQRFYGGELINLCAALGLGASAAMFLDRDQGQSSDYLYCTDNRLNMRVTTR